jgi:hypothetical protein
MGKLVVFLAVLALAASTPLSAQYPGQYPPGTYPPGQYPGPGGGGGIPMPGRHKKGQKQSGPQQPTISAEGKTVSNDGTKLVIATEDGRTLTMAVTPQTKFTRSGSDIAPNKIVPRTTVHIEAAEDDQANLTATKVDLVKDAPAESDEQAQGQPGQDGGADEVRPTILDNSVDAPNRPILRHGAPQKTNSSNDDSDDDVQVSKSTPAVRPAAPKDSGDFTIDGETASVKKPSSANSDLISKTKEWSLNFTNGLPNFVCQQMTTRYVEQSRASGWQPLDVITAKVVYEDGKEDYREITVGGRRTNKSMLELGGSTSTGEFASTLRSLFSEHSQAQFKFYQSTTVTGSPAAIYDFKVGLHNSDWFITVGGQSLRPAYSGSVWIDRSSGEVRRIEMQADNIPQDFPLDSVEWAVDYDNVLLGGSKFLLPVHAENLGCQRGSSICTKNSIDFRDYHRYTGESTITFK